jgi:hypothetical protein
MREATWISGTSNGALNIEKDLRAREQGLQAYTARRCILKQGTMGITDSKPSGSLSSKEKTGSELQKHM